MTKHLFIIALVFAFLFMGAGAVQPYLTPYFQHCCTISAEAAGLIVALVYIAFAVTRFFSGIIIYYTGIKQGIVIGAGTYLLFIIIILIFPTLIISSLAAVMWGIGAAFLWTSSSSYILNIALPGKYGLSTGIQRLFLQSGIIVGFIMLAEMIHYNGNYQGGFIFAGCVTCIGFLLTFVLRKTKTKPVRIDIPRALKNFGNKQFIPLYLYVFTTGSSYGIILNVMNRFIRETYGYQFFNGTIILFYVAGGISTFIMGYLSDFKGRKKVISWAFVCGITASCIMIRSQSIAAAATVSFFLGIMFQVVPTVVTARIGDITKPEERPGIIAGVFIWRDIGIAAAIMTGGLFSTSKTDLKRVFSIFLALFIVACIVSIGEILLSDRKILKTKRENS